MLTYKYTYTYTYIMKTLTLHIEESVYRSYKDHAAERGVSAAELVREAMRRYAESELTRGASLAELRPTALGPRYDRLDLTDLGEELFDDRP